MMLLHGEQILRSDSVELATADGHQPGELHLTNYRLIFERIVSRGFLRGETVRTVLDVSLDRVADVHIERRLLGRPRMIVDIPTLGAHSFRTLDPEGWRESIAAGRRAYRPPAPAGGSISPQIVVNVHTPPSSSHAPAHPPPTYLHCRYCGALNVAGGSPGPLRCGSCGAAL